jgi:hypothetical protein
MREYGADVADGRAAAEDFPDRLDGLLAQFRLGVDDVRENGVIRPTSALWQQRRGSAEDSAARSGRWSTTHEPEDDADGEGG